MGDILDKITTAINTDDYNHNWTTTSSTSTSPEDFFEEIVEQIAGPFVVDGFKLLKQSFPYKGIRYGGSSLLDKSNKIYSALSLTLSESTQNKVQDSINSLVDKVFFGNDDDNSSSSSSACTSAGAAGIFKNDLWYGNIQKNWFSDMWGAKASDEIFDTINKYASDTGVPPAAVLAQLYQEGGFNPHPEENPSAHAKGYAQFLKDTWNFIVIKAKELWTDVDFAGSSWTEGGPSKLPFGIMCQMVYMSRIHKQIVDGGVDDTDFFWASVGYYSGPGRALAWANYINKNYNGDRTKLNQVGKMSKSVTGVNPYTDAFGPQDYGEKYLKFWGELSAAVPRSEVDNNGSLTSYESTGGVCSIDSGTVSSPFSWTPGQELNSFTGKESDSMSVTKYGVPRLATGRAWMKGEGLYGSQVEFDLAFKSAQEAASKEGHALYMGPGIDTFRTYEQQVATKKAKGDYAATPGSSIHGIGYATDIKGASGSSGTSATLAAKKWLRLNGPRWGIYAPLWDAAKAENWHFQLHPDLAYSLLQKYNARGQKWEE